VHCPREGLSIVEVGLVTTTIDGTTFPFNVPLRSRHLRGCTMGWSFAISREKLAIAAGLGTALVPALIATCYWDIRCRGADDLCALGYLIWLNRSLVCGPIIGAGVAALLSPGGRRRRSGLVTLGLAAAVLWTLLWFGHFGWGW
jgi:hypothetical protein